MKKILLVFVAFVLMSASLLAQFDIKIIGGINGSLLTSDPDVGKLEARPGFQFGGSLAIGKKWYVEPGVMYFQMSQELVNADNTSEAFKNTVGGIRIPVFVGYSIIKQSNDFLNFRIFTGPAMNYITVINSEVAGLRIDDYNQFQAGWNAGLGLSIAFVFIDVGYEWGMTKVFKEFDARNNALWGNIGIRIRI